MRVVCPQCDERIAIHRGQVGTKIYCQRCGESLRIHASSRKSRQELASPAESNAPSGERSPAASRSHAAEVDPATAEPAATAVMSHEQVAVADRILRAQRRVKSKRRQSIAALVVLAVLSLGGCYVVYQLVIYMQEEAARLAQLEAVEVDDAGQPEAATDPVADGAMPSADVAPAPPPVPRRPIEARANQYFTAREITQAWDRGRPHILELLVLSAAGERSVGGTLVDPQGWMVTSLSALDGATRLIVRQPPPSPMADGGEDQLSDDVRGVLGIFPEHDLVLLQVNRRLVTALTPLTFETRRLTTSQHFVQIAPPGDDRWPWATECRINLSPLERGVEADQMNATQLRQFNVHRHPLGHRPFSTSSPGGGLFTTQGTLAGVNSGIVFDGDLMIVDASTVQSLLSQINGEVASLDSLPGFSAPVTNPAPTDEPEPEVMSAVDQAGWQSLEVVRRTSAALSQRQWQAAAETDYAEWQSLAKHYLEIVRIADDPGYADEVRRQCIRESERVLGELRRELPALSSESVRQMNTWGQRQRESASRGGADPTLPVVLIVSVHLPIIDSPEIANRHTVTLRVEETNAYLIAYREPGEAVLMRDTTWLLFGQWSGQPPRSFLDGSGNTLRADALTILSLPVRIR